MTQTHRFNKPSRTREDLYKDIRHNLKHHPAYRKGTNVYKLLMKHAPHLFEEDADVEHEK